jgi:predicted transcriptional regulator
MIVRIFQKITVFRSQKPVRKNLNEDLQWLATSLGLFTLRDKDKSMFRIFIELLKGTKKGKALSSDELADKLKLTRGTVMHHVNKLMEKGLVVADRNKYLLRVGILAELIDELEHDSKRIFKDMREVEGDIDKYLGV